MRKPFYFSQIDWVSWFLILVLVGIVAYLIIGIYLQIVGIQAGYVYEKDFTRGRCDTTYINERPHVTCYPDSYTLYIEDMQDDRRVTNWHEVTSQIWHEAQIGQWYDAKCFCLHEAKP